MSETKRVKNSSGSDISVEYGGATYRFDAGTETEVAAGLADVAQLRHGHAGLLIVHPEPVVRKAAVVAPPRGPAGEKFRCPHGDFSTNVKAEYDNHLASAHGLSEQARKDAEAKALPDRKRTKKAETARRLKGATPAGKKAIKAEVKKDDKARAKKAHKEKA